MAKLLCLPAGRFAPARHAKASDAQNSHSTIRIVPKGHQKNIKKPSRVVELCANLRYNWSRTAVLCVEPKRFPMARLSVSLLGSFNAFLDQYPALVFESDKTRALLGYLAVEMNQPHRREKLAGLLWPERSEMCARHSLSQALCNLRQVIDDAAVAPPILLVSAQEIQFNAASDHWVDTTALTGLIAQRAAHCRGPLTCSACLERMEQAVALRRGSFMEGFSLGDSMDFEEWLLLHRERFDRLVRECFDVLILSYEQRADYPTALSYAWQHIEMDPWREEAHRYVMRLLALTGRRSEALAHYEKCRYWLIRDLGMAPATETQGLYQEIKAGAALTSGVSHH